MSYGPTPDLLIWDIAGYTAGGRQYKACSTSRRRLRRSLACASSHMRGTVGASFLCLMPLVQVWYPKGRCGEQMCRLCSTWFNNHSKVSSIASTDALDFMPRLEVGSRFSRCWWGSVLVVRLCCCCLSLSLMLAGSFLDSVDSWIRSE